MSIESMTKQFEIHDVKVYEKLVSDINDAKNNKPVDRSDPDEKSVLDYGREKLKHFSFR